LLDIGRALRSGGDLEPVLTAIAAGLLRATGFTAVVINMRRPEWDDFEVVVSLGEEDDGYAALMGATTTWSEWGKFLVPEFEHDGAYFIPAGTIDWSSDTATYVPDRPASDDPGDWHPEDALLIPLTDSHGELLGIVSVDEPASGRRPDAAQLELVALAARTPPPRSSTPRPPRPRGATARPSSTCCACRRGWARAGRSTRR